VVHNNFTEGSQIRRTILLEGRTKNFFHKSLDTFCFIALTKSVTQNIRGVTKRHCLNPFLEKNRRQALTEYIFRLRSRRHQLSFK